MVARWGLRQEERLDGALRASGLVAACAYHGGSGYNIHLKDGVGTK